MPENKKVLLGMSGGVDSSVSAILLKKQGYDVTGITLAFLDNEEINAKNANDAKKVCNMLGIEHITFDKSELFKQKVIKNFVDEYKNCRTPNPCIVCNKFMKFGWMYDIARELNIEYIATGHYAKKEFSKKYNRYVIKKADNIKKDQSYFLYDIPKEVIKYAIFPLSNYESKEQIRQIAKEEGLEVAEKPDSEDICFIENRDYKTFLEKCSNISYERGDIIHIDGRKLGEHNGLFKYTIGQRRGLGIANSEPLFVIGFNKERNEVIVGEEDKLYKREAIINNINLLAVDEINKPLRVNVKTRYTSRDSKAVIIPYENDEKNKKIKILFDDAQRALTPGQSAVFYDDCGILIGGGIIS